LHRQDAHVESGSAPPARGSRGGAGIAADLRRAIESGRYREGDRLPPERELAASFGAARSTVRRALDELQRSGLVSRRLGSGTFVIAALRQADKGDVAELISPLQLIETRFAVEPHTTRLAVLNATRRDLADMEAALARGEASGADKDAFSRSDGEFHLAIARASRNPLLAAFYAEINRVRLHAQWDAMKEQILDPAAIAEYRLQHRGILEAIARRDGALAEARVLAHLETARADLLRAKSG
jgi:GntR family uxuAB operon transcriptional repressor